MITTRRNETETTKYLNESSGNIAVAERAPVYSAPVKESVLSDTERMKKNLEYLMNYDKYITEESQQEIAMSSVVVEDKEVVEMQDVQACDQQDLQPSSTTMQFAENNMQELYGDMKNDEKLEKGFHLTTKHKVMIAIYSVVVTIIMSLIILNTTVLSNLGNKVEQKAAQVAELKAQYQTLKEDIADISSDEYIIGKAEEMGMIK